MGYNISDSRASVCLCLWHRGTGS